ncbi:CGNR zinc finger domain-containing protein [Kribbella sp. NBC_01245]|uniref:CGNR zinc finger domain-containing protein n=1 Tax=Kribbella sp. NBC_01245 TaxID=2903578 RepID=UPI002E2BD65D|nr:CGNR zinc finger domain-containing protein [Kribbella sp. NBC_01245]
MTFSHDTEQALGTLVRLVNTLPAPGSQVDEMETLEDLDKFVHDREFSAVGQLTTADLEEVRSLRGMFAPVFTTGSDAEAAGLINGIIARGASTPKLTNHDGHPWHVHYSRDDASLASRITVECGIALAQVIASGERERLRRCEAPDCDDALIDLSRNRSKRYCDARTCGNRLHVAAYRERRKSAGD